MFALLPLAVALCGVLTIGGLVALAGATPRLEAPGARPWLRRSRLRCWVAIAATVGTGVLLGGTAALRPDLSGLTLALLPGLAAIAGLLAHAVVPYATPPHSGPTAARLAPRGPWTSSGRADLLVPGGLGVLTIAVLLVTGLTAAPDEGGHDRIAALTSGSVSASHGPYPGWYYAVPLMVVTAAVLGALALALVRVGAAPAPPVAELFDADVALRRLSTTVISRLTSAALLADLGGILAITGLAQRALAKTAEITGVTTEGLRLLIGTGLLYVGLLALAAAVVFAGLALAATLRTSVRPAGRIRVAA